MNSIKCGLVYERSNKSGLSITETDVFEWQMFMAFRYNIFNSIFWITGCLGSVVLQNFFALDMKIDFVAPKYFRFIF